MLPAESASGPSVSLYRRLATERRFDMKILFMGTPDFAAECLRTVLRHDASEVAAVVTQPDRRCGRGMKLRPTPVKTVAEENGITVYQPETLRDGAFESTLREIDPELIIVAAYGRILPHYIISYPKFGCVNAHASLLPRHRGAAPINRAIMDGDTETGITSMYMDDGLDTGDIILMKRIGIGDCDDVGTLHDRLASLAGEAMLETIDRIADGTVTRTPQPESGVTYASKITSADCEIDFSRTAREIRNQIRGLSPVPLARTRLPDGRLLKIASAVSDDDGQFAAPGTVISTDGGEISVACGEGRLRIMSVTPEGRSRMSAADFIRGRGISVGDVLGSDNG